MLLEAFVQLVYSSLIFRCRQTLSKILLLVAIAYTSKTSLNSLDAKFLCGFVPIAQSACVVAICDRPQLHQD